MKKTLLSLVFLVTIILSNAQTTAFQWAKSFGGTGFCNGNSIALDASRNVYTAGTFSGTADFDPSAGTFNLTSSGGTDIFISKIDSSGNFIWAKRIGGILADYERSLALDSLGNVYTTGWYRDTVDFDPGVGTFNLTSNSGSDFIFISKLDASGNFLWAKSMSDTLNGYGLSIAIDESGNVYSTGDFGGTADFDPGPGIFNLATSTGAYDIFISKLDSSGNFQWAKNMGGALSAIGNSIKTDAAGNIYTTGEFSGIADFDPNAGIYNLTADTGSANIFVLKLNALGDFVWAKKMGGTPFWDSRAISIAIDTSGNVYTTGDFMLTTDFDPGPAVFNLTAPSYGALFISKLDSSGNFVWAKSIVGSGGTDIGISIVLDAANNLYITGSAVGTTDFDPGAGISNLASAGSLDIFILKLDSFGNFIWARQIGGTGYDQGTSIALDTSGNIYTTGCFQNTADFDQGPGVFNITPAGGQDSFIHKMSPSLSIAGITEGSLFNNLAIYPNPTSGIFNVIVGRPAKNARIEVYNSIGTLVYNNQITTEQIIIELTNQSNGLYFIKVMSDNKIIACQKIVKQ